ncbi:zinc finger CCCH domain-containing protein 41 [Gossypium raimondii]|uniref:zinc finger CCCH domain-containing protein 41 n=1 Tax=Gossypium raimondii TaxID=29730 RepID=UPI00227C4F2E|nr:zinc finger CCCH domain-containing protein 41 [Gossypium raimondii]XP_012459374.2 zinc finger CCCH domain-containing protein 41 [Gossypium raimondii]XP_012459375.2 zinc finger CCCH domain-containing protein 41 [Gossypium raimondii]XP_012459376.2 zinc finger CCCH domain-containing protein 41 [Gossypium raimondii]XP_012459377.2 zinc finger CCCH domain-containing protein 41 [Gossypium raimondii]
MELKVSSPKLGGLSPPGCVSDPEEKEVSDEDDDDRNHKHRRRETRSQSLETDSMDPAFTKSYRKRNKFFENGQPFRENESQAGETWKSNNSLPLDKDLTSKFDRRRPGLASLPRGHVDVNQRVRSNQPFSGDSGPGRGRGRDNSSWNQRDSRFNSIDIASQMVHPGSVAPSLFAGRGLPNVSNAQSPSWGAFGMMPGIPNGGLDTLHPIGLPGVLRPPMNSSLNMGIPRQRCRDFEERGFCLRGDMCPMEHGVNRIVIEDVQSLSQFNLPVTVPSAQLLATPAAPRPLPSSVPPTTLMSSKGIHSKSSKSGMTDDALGLNGAYTGSTSASVADLYDPDQPLWNNNGPEASTAVSGLHSPKIDEAEPFLSGDISDRHHGRLHENADNELASRSIGSQGTSLSVWGRIGSPGSRTDTKEKIDLAQSAYPENETKEDQEAFPSSQGTSCQVKRISTEDDGSKFMDTSFKSQTDSMHNSRKPTQKALRTLFVNGIPLKSNKREALLSHFRKFGEVIDIYIPKNSERAFVQFSRREEAEAALKAPDAVMGNRFIKLWWANRDSVPDDGINSGSSVTLTSRGPTVFVIPAQAVVNRGGKDNLQPIAQKSNAVHGAAVPSVNSPKPSGVNGPKVQLPLQKKLETLEQMKEELRKKQEMLEQKRNDFRRQLDKLQKQSSGVKGDLPTEQAAKKQKVGIAADPAKASTPSLSEPGAPTTIPCTVGMTDKNKSTENVGSHGPTSNATMSLQESKSSKQQSCPSAPTGYPFLMNKYKLDNRPTAFRVIPPLPSGFADVDVLKEHFLQYGDLSAVEIEDVENDNDMGSEAMNNCSIVITYGTRWSAERAYVNGKCWQGNNLQFTWLTSSNSSNDPSSKETSSSTPKGTLEADVQTEGELEFSVSPEVIASGDKESKNSEGESFVENMALPEVSEHSSSPSSCMKESPKGDAC